MNVPHHGRAAALGLASVAVAVSALSASLPANANPAADTSSAIVTASAKFSAPAELKLNKAVRVSSDQNLCGIDEFTVPESTRRVLGSVWYSYGESVVVTPDVTKQIWAGVWFTGWNGPAGWTDSPAPSDYPLPGAPEYSLIGRLGNGPWQYIGNRPLTFTQQKAGYLQKLVLRTNDNNPGNGDGAFYATTDCT
jgi:hypothetical protein